MTNCSAVRKREEGEAVLGIRCLMNKKEIVKVFENNNNIETTIDLRGPESYNELDESRSLLHTTSVQPGASKKQT